MEKENFILTCSKCNAKNRVPKEKIKDKPVCGKCKAPISIENAYDHPVNITDQTFQKEVLQFPGAVLVDCWAPWCGPCRAIAPLLDQISKEYAGRIKITKLNVDENQITASTYAVQSIPTMLFFKNGKKVDSAIGAIPKMEIVKRIQNIL